VAATERFRPGAATRGIMDAVFDAGIATDEPQGRRAFADLSRRLLYVRGHYLRMPLRLLVRICCARDFAAAPRREARDGTVL